MTDATTKTLKPRLTQEKVFAACELLSRDGKLPTLRALLEHLGSGGYSTISRFRSEWISERARAGNAAGSLPEGLSRPLQMFWAQAEEEARTLFNQQREELEAQMKALEERHALDEQRMAQLQSENDALRPIAKQMEVMAQALQSNGSVLSALSDGHARQATVLDRIGATQAALAGESRAAFADLRSGVDRLPQRLADIATAVETRIDRQTQLIIAERDTAAERHSKLTEDLGAQQQDTLYRLSEQIIAVQTLQRSAMDVANAITPAVRTLSARLDGLIENLKASAAAERERGAQLHALNEQRIETLQLAIEALQKSIGAMTRDVHAAVARAWAERKKGE